MLSDEELLQRLKSPEDLCTERKSKGASSEDIRKTLVAFANSVPEDREGVLFIGIGDQGEVLGVDDPDGLQKRIRTISGNKCYPPVTTQCRVLLVDGTQVVA